MQLSRTDIITKAEQIYRQLPFRQAEISGPVNPDNICFGSLGQAFFALALYKATKNECVWNDIQSWLKKMEQNCLPAKSNNYSFYCGRLGMAFFYLRLYQHTMQPDFLRRSEQIAFTYFNNDEQYLKFFENCSLLDGQSSLLLFCVCLYQQTGNPRLLEIMHSYLRAMLREANVTNGNIYWHGITGKEGRKLGWSYGCAGIAMVLLECGRIFDRDRCLDFAAAVLDCEFEERGRISADFNADDSAVHGWAGAAFTGLYFDCLSGRSRYEAWFNNLVEETNDREGNVLLSIDIENGLSGLGMLFNQAYYLTGNIVFRQKARQLATAICLDDRVSSLEAASSYSFLQGISGIGYFLLQCFDEQADCLLAPGISFPGNSNIAVFTDEQSPGTGAALPPLKSWIFSRSFNKSLAIVEKNFHGETDVFLRSPGRAANDAFADFVNNLDKGSLDMAKQQELEECMTKEIFVANLISRADSSLFPDLPRYIKKLKKISACAAEELLPLTVSISPGIHILELEERIDFDLPLTVERLSSILSESGERTWLFKVNRFDLLEEFCYARHKIYIDLFRQSCVVQHAVERATGYFVAKDIQVTRKLQSFFKVRDELSLRKKICQEVLDSVRHLLLLDVLDYPYE